MAINKRLIKSNEGGAGVATSFNTVVYSGNVSTNPITSAGFQPDLVWIKCRTVSGESHWLTDSVRGAQKSLSSNQTIAEQNITNGLVSFDPDGFTVGSYTAFNSTSGGADNMVAWCWKAGGAAVTNTAGLITSQVSANVGAGFSIVSYTGNGGDNQTVGHGLGNTPSIVITKNRNKSGGLDGNWAFGFMPNSSGAYLNLDAAFDTGRFIGFFGSGTNSNTFTVSTGGTFGHTNENGDPIIAYCFAEVAGFSKFGSYTGAVGKTIDFGFEPAFVMIKKYDTAYNWNMYDNKRGASALDDRYMLLANASNAEFTSSTVQIDFTSNGISFPNSYDGTNQTGGQYIYMAFK